MADTTTETDARSILDSRVAAGFEELQKVEHEPTRSGRSRREFNVDPNLHPVLLVEDAETGLLAWSFPVTRRSGAGVEFEFDVEAPAQQQRGVLSQVGRKILRVLVPRVVDLAIEQAGRSLARRWEETDRPEGLRRFDPEAASLGRTDDGFQPEPEQLRGGSALLLLHGPLSTTAGGFCDLRGLGLARLSERYEGRVLGYDHFTLSKSPEENAAGLVAALAPLRDQQVTLDVIAHSRGGLVARKLAELALDPAHRITLDNVWLVGSPNLGTPACDIQNLGRFADRMTNLLSWLPLGVVGDVVDGVLAVVQHLLLTAAAGLPGVAAMDPKAREVDTAPLPDGVRFFGIASEYAPVRGAPLADRAKHLLASPLLGRPNDLFVPQGSVFGPRDDPLIPDAHQLRYAPAEAVMHTGYFDHPNTVAFVLDSGEARGSTRSGAATVAFVSRQHSVVGEDSTVVSFSVTHASLEEAEYGLMVGSFADEGLSGAERYLDARLGGILRARYDIDHYPGELGSSMFIDPDPDRPTMPAAAYVVGLGPTTELGNLELASAVRQALVRRCLRLYDVPHPAGGLVEVGVSSILMGVRNNDGLSIPDSVAGVAQGVIDANARLAQYEANLEQADITPKVRVTRLEFVERYADRADAAAVAVRALPGTIRLGRGYRDLGKITVMTGPGGLPPGSGAAEGPIDWRRFLITEAPADEQPPTTSTEQSRPLVLDVALLGGEAGAGRIRHRLNRTIVDALVDRLADAPDDTDTAATLYDHLVPDEIRQRFKTSGSVQLIVDAVTANYPFELLTAPRPGRRFSRQAMAVSGSVLRQFTETGQRRLSVHRATERSALIIGAGKVNGQNALPAAHAEAEAVHAALAADELYQPHLLHDKLGELDVIELSNELFSNHRILHIASHGEYEEGKPELTGAILSSQYLLTVDTVRVLRWVPDLVFLNCCSLGRIGLPRLAAGLAREFMAIGTRAVVAAGWPIADSAALAFAEAFYDRMLGGAVFGDAVAAGRIAASEGSGGQTWAAYQCYGDPAFDLAVPRSKQRAATSDPISRDDLVHRIAALGIRASDLRRVDGTVLETGHASHLEELDALASWAASHRLATDVAVQRQLAQVAKALGDFGRAAERYQTVVTTVRNGYRPRAGASVADVREFANCRARAGQRQARAASTPEERSAAIDAMCDALVAARSAVRLQPDKESWGIKGSTLKKLATVDEENRQAHLAGALQAYTAARACDDEGDYGAENALQLAAILGVETPVAEEPAAPAVAVSGAGHRVIDQRQLPGTDFWAKAAAGDRALTRLLEAKEDDEAETHQREMVDAYQAAFATRSTWSERNSCLEHLGDLLDLTNSRRGLIESAREELRAWEAENVQGAEAAGSTSVAGAQGATPPSRSRRAGHVTVVALPAGRGDCLWVEYGDPSARARLLIDGGLRSAYKGGLAAHLARLGNREPVAFETLVVTHVDLDHIEGAIEAVKSGGVTFGDVWFNGIAQPNDNRGPRQGDEFEMLLPPSLRNKVNGGRHLVVEDSGPLSTYRLAAGAVCTLLSPNRDRLQRLLDLWVKSRDRGAEDTPVDALAQRLDADDPELTERGGPRRFGSDASVANGSSIAFLFEYGDVAALFTGDAFASVLQSSIERLLTDRGSSRLRLDLFKLSHHGSHGNITPELLELIDCDRFLISTDGWKGKHPSPETVELIKRVRPGAELLFNYSNEFTSAFSQSVKTLQPQNETEPLRVDL